MASTDDGAPLYCGSEMFQAPNRCVWICRYCTRELSEYERVIGSR